MTQREHKDAARDRIVLSYDAGIRHLAVALIACPACVPFPPECRVYASPDETRDAFDLRALQFFVRHGGWRIVHWRVMDASETLERSGAVRRVKQLGPVAMTTAIVNTLQQIDTHIGDADIDTVAVEAQHNGNAVMRGVAMAIFAFYKCTRPAAQLESVSGRHKLTICDALGIALGAGNAVTKSGKKRKLRVGAAGGTAGTPALKCASKYEDNKHRAILALNVLFPDGHEALRAAGLDKKDDLADALLQALWIAWTHVAPKPPRRARAAKTTKTTKTKTATPQGILALGRSIDVRDPLDVREPRETREDAAAGTETVRVSKLPKPGSDAGSAAGNGGGSGGSPWPLPLPPPPPRLRRRSLSSSSSSLSTLSASS